MGYSMSTGDLPEEDYREVLKKSFCGRHFHAPASVKQRGVMISLSRVLHWQNLVTYLEPEGQFLIIKGQMLGMIAGVYAPQIGKKLFFRKRIKKF